MTNTQKKYNLTLTDAQCQIMSNALEFYVRIGIGQIDEIRHVAVPAKGHKADLEMVDVAIARLKDILLGWEYRGTTHGIHSRAIPDSFRVCFDIHQVIRHRLAYDSLKPGEVRMMTVNFDEPRRTSTESELPKINSEKERQEVVRGV